MSSPTIPDENSAGEFDEFSNDSAQSSNPNVEPDFLNKIEPMPNFTDDTEANRQYNNLGNPLPLLSAAEKSRYWKESMSRVTAGENDREQKSEEQLRREALANFEDQNLQARQQTSLNTGRKTLRDAVVKGADNSIRRKLIIDKIANSQYSQLSKPMALKLATKDFNTIVSKKVDYLHTQHPDLAISEIRVLAEQEVLSAKGSFANLLGSSLGFSSAANKLEKKATDALKLGIQTAIPFFGSIITFLIFSKAGRLILLCVCLCFMFLVVQVYQLASEDKVTAVIRSPNLLNCAGSKDNVALLQCLGEAKTKEYTESLTPNL